ncbi:hypothetical protein DM02DRAFT_630226 [Periconia macrospinosa]|uniref:Protein EFR3 n=1 Tax=Periconia macrospinosa TaxID=97972 RepID=A0A2V1DJR4_9PLEO|nr:hypothetical protein DM02DRAFT_630226 [Periconia macrospinosa]
MNAARQACRPKHQVLVLKCYPKFQKNNVEVKANSSELSYLLYYASTRRSKLQKVGDFLDKRMTADVWKGRTGNVQVTLEILKALIEKCPRDLPLFAAAVLRSLRTILNSKDVAMVEDSVPTFESLCANQDPANLAAEQDYIKQYEEVVRLYAHFASRDVGKGEKTPFSWPVAIRYRKSGLRALKAVAASESLGAETGRQIDVLIPVILNNIWAEDGSYLKTLAAREKNEHEEQEKEEAVKRRQSVSTARTDEEEGDPIAASGTTEEADKLAEQEVGVLALQALRHIFLGVNRGQMRIATKAVLAFIGAHVKPQDKQDELSMISWATTLISMVCGWAPVQDRYMILVYNVENLVKSPIVEEDLERQLVLATVINHLLSSPINFIGLSVMDVLVGLIAHTLLLLQLGGPGTAIMPHSQQTTPVLDSEKPSINPKSSGSVGGVVIEVSKDVSKLRLQLLDTVKKCMASLATHVYYTDQISDMVATILARLKPSPLSEIANATEAIEDPVGAAKAIASSAGLQERSPGTDRFFSFETARLTALETVKNIIRTANLRRPDGSSASVPRSSVGVKAWEGTQWLLRDPSGQVRKAYVDALLTWLNLEKGKEDLKLADDYRKDKKDHDKGGLARRAVSNASQRDKSPKRVKNTFLALLHLAVYDNALQFVDSQPDLLLLHLLLTTLVNKLGVNAARNGLPMILRLQEDIVSISNPGSKVRIGSLVHGYLWALSIAMDFETSSVGRTLHAEISRRSSKGLWVKEIRVPPMPLDRIDTPHNEPVKLPTQVVETEALKPFDLREALVDRIAEGYATTLNSPPASPPSSPGRSMSIALSSPQTLRPLPQLSFKVKEELLAEWTKEACLASNVKDPSSASMTGSKTAASGQQKNNYLGVTIPNGNLDSANNSPLPSPHRAHSRSRPPSTAYGLIGRSPHRRNHSPSETPGSTSSLHSSPDVKDLKRVLAGAPPRSAYSVRPPTSRFEDSVPDSSASESMVSVHSLTDASFITADPTPADEAATTPTVTTTPRPQSPPSPNYALAAHKRAYSREAVPPVPPIPASLRDKNTTSPTGSPSFDNTSTFERPKTAPNNNTEAHPNGTISVAKTRGAKRSSARSLRERSTSRGRSGTVTSAYASTLDGVDRMSLGAPPSASSKKAAANGAGAGRKSKPDFSEFLKSISVDGESEGESDEEDGGFGGRGRGVGAAPY